ncbi:hypothetical protein BKA61DRAFT_346585 [Leptodontidium sp. MPI-SDFR-AT-0119]|nr:hypothetical protein BKA61DRAFT_346585 [Leptodontidium sp. MPI-SDFR-AT-0119]
MEPRNFPLVHCRNGIGTAVATVHGSTMKKWNNFRLRASLEIEIVLYFDLLSHLRKRWIEPCEDFETAETACVFTRLLNGAPWTLILGLSSTRGGYEFPIQLSNSRSHCLDAMECIMDIPIVTPSTTRTVFLIPVGGLWGMNCPRNLSSRVISWLRSDLLEAEELLIRSQFPSPYWQPDWTISGSSMRHSDLRPYSVVFNTDGSARLPCRSMASNDRSPDHRPRSEDIDAPLSVSVPLVCGLGIHPGQGVRCK